MATPCGWGNLLEVVPEYFARYRDFDQSGVLSFGLKKGNTASGGSLLYFLTLPRV